MGITHFFRRFSLGTGISSGIRKIQESSLHSIRNRKVLGGALIVASILFGLWAHESAKAQALEEWERSHFPSSRVWKAAFESRGWREERDPKILQKALREIPANVDEKSAVWLSTDVRWAAVFVDPENVIPAKVFCRDCEATAQAKWKPIGMGWPGFDDVFKSIDESPLPVKKVFPKRREFLDPREIRY